MISTEQVFMGSAVALLCLVGLWNERWLLAESAKGRILVRWFGDSGAPWALRALLAAGFVFGVLLATGVLNPIRWGD